jgi:hypothetical protein
MNAFVILSAGGALSGRAASSADFSPHVGACVDGDVISFPNTSGDAELVVPCGASPEFGHLASFCKQVRLWRTVADRIGKSQVFVSTDGRTVPWLHVRLDRAPKYFKHKPYLS